MRWLTRLFSSLWCALGVVVLTGAVHAWARRRGLDLSPLAVLAGLLGALVLWRLREAVVAAIRAYKSPR